MLIRLLRRGGALLALALVGAAAVASLFGPEPVQRLVGRPWFSVGAALVAAGSLAAGVLAARRREWSSVAIHLGLVAALVGVWLNQVGPGGGYLFLELRGGAKNYCLSRSLQTVEELPFSVRLDSLAYFQARGFRPAPRVWLVTGTGGSEKKQTVTYNRTLNLSGRSLMLSQVVEPGFPHEYEVVIDGREYVLLHNQRVHLSGGATFWSFAYDAAANRIGFVVGDKQQWLAVGDSAHVGQTSIRLMSADFAPNMGAIMVVNDIRRRPVIFFGLGLSLMGLLGPLLRREES